VRLQLFSERLERVEAKEELVIEFNLREASRDSKIHEMATQHGFGWFFFELCRVDVVVEMKMRSEAHDDSVGCDHVEKIQSFDSGGNERRVVLCLRIETAHHLSECGLERHRALET